MADLVVKPKNTMQRGVIMPPPPIPATVDRAIKIKMTIMPPISIGSAGNKGLWTHLDSLHKSKG